MNKSKIFFLLLFLFLVHRSLFAGFAAGTFVKVPCGYKLIENLNVGDFVYSMSSQGSYRMNKIQSVTSYCLPSAIKIVLDQDIIIAAPNQKFYKPRESMWEKAKNLNSNMLLGIAKKGIQGNFKIYKVNTPTDFFDIRLNDLHTFCISTHDIVVHNFPLCFIGFSIAWGSGKIVFDSLYCGICIAGWWLGTKLLKNTNPNAKCKVTVTPSMSYGSPDPDDPEWKNKNPHGRYEDSPKHHSNSRGAVGRSPKNGQTALNRSVLMDEGPSRVAIEDNHFVVLRQTSSRVYHGYIVEEFTNLPRAARESLYYAKLVRCITKGKIIK